MKSKPSDLYDPMKSPFLIILNLFPMFFLAGCADGNLPDTPINTTAVFPTHQPVKPSPTMDPGIITAESAGRLVQIMQLGMGEAVGSPVFSPDGRRMFQATTSGVFEYETASYASRLFTPYSALSGYDQILALSPDAALLAVGDDLVSTARSEIVFHLDTNWPGTLYAAFSPDGSLLARAMGDKEAQGIIRVGIWRLGDGSLLSTFETKTPGPLGFSSDGHFLAIQSEMIHSPFFEIYDTQSGERIFDWAGERSVFLPDNRLAVESEGTIRIFDLNTGAAQQAFSGRFAASSSDGKLIALLKEDRIRVYRIAEKRVLADLDAGSAGLEKAILRFSPDSTFLAVYTAVYCCGGHTNLLALWRLDSGTLINRYDESSDLFAFSPDGKSLAVSIPNDSTKIFNTTDGSLQINAGAYNLRAGGVAFLAEENRLVVAGLEDTVYHEIGYPPLLYFFDLGSGKLIEHPSRDELFQTRIAPGYERKYYTSGNHSIAGCCLALSPDGKKSAAGWYRSLFITDLSTKSRLLRVDNLPADAVSLSFSPDGRYVAVSFVVGVQDAPYPIIQVWEALPQGRLVMELEAGRGVSMVDYSPDGRFIAAGGRKGIVIWNAGDGSIRFTIDRPVADFMRLSAQGASRMAFSPDGRILAIGLTDGSIELWDPEKGTKIRSVEATGNPYSTVFNLAFSQDGKLIAGGYGDGGVRLFGIR